MNQGRTAGNSTGVGGSSRVGSVTYWGAIAALVAVAALGIARERRVSELTASINAGVPSERRLANALIVLKRVASRFQWIREHGKMGELAPWPLRTGADYLLTGGSCGEAAQAMGAVFVRRGRPFRFIQINIGAGGPAHIMVETQDDAQRWVLIDPLDGESFQSPRSGRHLGIEEIRALPTAERAWLPHIYREEWSLFGPYRRTNWDRLGPVAGVVRALAGDERMREISIRAELLEPGRRLTEGAMVLIMLLAVARALGERRRVSASNTATGGSAAPISTPPEPAE